jgi:hypothetical protein
MAEEDGQETQDEGEKELTRREARIQELTRRNTELERLVNMDNRMQETARVTQQTAQAVGQIASKLNQPAEDAEDKWTPFLKPKMGKLLEEALTPYKNAIIQLADKNDRLETMHKFPEYGDPEIEQEVETIRQQRAQQTGQYEPRENILHFLKGQKPERFAGKGRKPAATEEAPNRQEEQSQVHVESKITSTPPNRAIKGKTLDLNTASAADIEKWATESGFGDQPI